MDKKLKIIVVGGTGILGSEVVKLLSEQHEVIPVGYTGGDYTVDISNVNSINSMFEEIGSFDALISTVGNTHFGPFDKMTEANFRLGLDHKLMGQINLVRIGYKFIRDNGSFTLTSGMVSGDEPIRGGVSNAMTHGALEGFVRSAALELSRGIRMNIVCMTIVDETMAWAKEHAPDLADAFSGYEPIPASRPALAFRKSVEGIQNGRVYKVWGSN
ncbi:short chain dehydrogenase [Aeromonas jandaei]|uniref:short chain dehydrogenase n=1 Tax=Aeromonas jandaei TaxID=650 RepID=UPI003B9FB4BD